MAIISILILFCASLFIFCALEKMISVKKPPNKSLQISINYSFKSWTTLDVIALFLTGSTAIFIALALLITLGFTFPKSIAYSLYSIICGSTVIFAIIHYRIDRFYLSHTTAFNLLGAILTIIITLIANSLADDAITGYTNVEASQFSAAQKTLTFIGVIGIWLYIIMRISLPTYLLIALHAAFNFIRFTKKTPKYVNSYTANSIFNKKLSYRGLILTLGFSYSVIIYLGFLQSLTSSADIQLKKILVFSSFHLPPEACDIKTSITGTKIALINDKKTVVAKPDRELGYTFTIEECKIQPPIVERKPLAPIHYLKDTHTNFISSKNISPMTCPVRYCSVLNSGPCI